MYILLDTVEREGKTYYYMNFAVDPRVWVSRKLVDVVEGKPRVLFPLEGELVRTNKGTWVIRPEFDTWTYWIEVGCGYRGESHIEVPDLYVHVHIPRYHSPRGSLGISDRVIVTIPKDCHPVKFDFRRSGRHLETQDRYGYVEIARPGVEPEYYYGITAAQSDDFFALLEE